MGKKSGSGMNIQDHFSGSLETVFRAKIVKFFDADTDEGPECFWPGIRDRKIRIWDKHPGSATLVRCLLILMILQVPTVPLVKCSLVQIRSIKLKQL